MTTQQKPNVISVEIDPKTNRYLFWTVMWVTAVTVVGIPFMPFIAIFYWAWYAPRYRQYHTLDLTETGVESKRGVVFRSQTNVPLDRITDVSVHQGPLMRTFDVYKLTVESAGQTQEQGAVSVIGVVDPYDFRDAVLANTELLKQGAASEAAVSTGIGATQTGADAQTELLTEIRDILARMEARES